MRISQGCQEKDRKWCFLTVLHHARYSINSTCYYDDHYFYELLLLIFSLANGKGMRPKLTQPDRKKVERKQWGRGNLEILGPWLSREGKSLQ
jgi:hypothetical protein